VMIVVGLTQGGVVLAVGCSVAPSERDDPKANREQSSHLVLVSPTCRDVEAAQLRARQQLTPDHWAIRHRLGNLNLRFQYLIRNGARSPRAQGMARIASTQSAAES